MSCLTLGLLCLASMLPEQETPLPPLSLANGLPSKETAIRLRDMAHDHWQLIGSNTERTHEELTAATDLYVIWQHVRSAADPSYTERERRISLRSLIERVGIRAVVTGQIPAPFVRGNR